MPDGLSPSEQRKLVGILGRLSSDHTGEVVAAAHLASTMLRRHGVTWESLLLKPSKPSAEAGFGWRSVIASCLQHPGLLSEWERQFLSTLWRRSTISPGQLEKLQQISRQLRERQAW